MRIYRRFAAQRLVESLEDSPVTLIHGPRQCGKTTLAQMVCAPRQLPSRHAIAGKAQAYWPGGLPASSADYSYITFDDAVAREAALSDSMGFVTDLPDRVILDEVQRVPQIFSSLKLAVDRTGTLGRFVLTGSSNVLLAPELTDSLAGRMETVRLHPLAQCELVEPNYPALAVDSSPGFLDSLLQRRFATRNAQRLGPELSQRIAAGGYPAALRRQPGRRQSNWYRNFLDAQVLGDVRELARIRSIDVLPRLLAVAASNTATLFNLADMAAPFELSRPTISNYIALLKQVFLLDELPAWHSNRARRLVKRPKIHVGDTGLACALIGVNAAGLAANRALLGRVLETFVYQELRRQASWHDSSISFFHLRDRDGIEVDIVLEADAQSIAGVEVKAGSTVFSSDFRGLRKLRSIAGSDFAAGIVLYDGEICARFDEDLFAVPIRFLWETN